MGVLIPLHLAVLVGAVGAQQWTCTNTCSYRYDGICDDGSPGASFSLCACGTDCSDCGTQWCGGSSFDDDWYYYDDDDSFCGSGYRTCHKGSSTWCCDKDSNRPRCSDTAGHCESKQSKKARKTAIAVLIAISILIPLGIIGGIVACCFCCEGCPGYNATHQRKDNNNNNPPGAANNNNNNVPTVTTVSYAQAPKQEIELQAA